MVELGNHELDLILLHSQSHYILCDTGTKNNSQSKESILVIHIKQGMLMICGRKGFQSYCFVKISIGSLY